MESYQNNNQIMSQNNNVNSNYNSDEDQKYLQDQKYHQDHIACIVVGNSEFHDRFQQTAKEQNKNLDELVGTDFLFGKYLNFEVSEKEWQNQLAELQKQLSDKNSKFANLKEIKFVLLEHGQEGNNRTFDRRLQPTNQYYLSQRFQNVAKIINENFLNKNENNKLYFSNLACYGTYNFNERNKKHDSDTHNNNGFRSNNVYEILSTTLGNNARKVYCSQLQPEIGINRVASINPNGNKFRNTVSLAQSISTNPSTDPDLLMNKKENNKKTDTDFIKQFWYESMRIIDPKIIEAPYCKIYFPLTQYRDVVPNALCLRPYEPKEYRVDSKIFEKYTGLQGKIAKNKFLGRQYPTKANIYHGDTQVKNMMSAKANEIENKIIKKRKEQEAQEAKKFNQQKKLQKANHEKNKAKANYNNYLLSLYNDKVNDINGCVVC